MTVGEPGPKGEIGERGNPGQDAEIGLRKLIREIIIKELELVYDSPLTELRVRFRINLFIDKTFLKFRAFRRAFWMGHVRTTGHPGHHGQNALERVDPESKRELAYKKSDTGIRKFQRRAKAHPRDS